MKNGTLEGRIRGSFSSLTQLLNEVLLAIMLVRRDTLGMLTTDVLSLILTIIPRFVRTLVGLQALAGRASMVGSFQV